MSSGRPDDWTIDKSLALAKGLDDWMDGEGLFWLEYLLQQKVHKDQLGYLQRKFAERKAKREKADSDGNLSRAGAEEVKKIDVFFRHIKSAQAKQELKLAKLALDNRSVGGAIFLLKNHHGYADKQEVKQETRQINVDASSLASKSMEELLALQEELSRG